MNGGKIMSLDSGGDLKIQFRDSLSYNPQALAKWPKTFGLPELSKGYFPHRFNAPQNWNKQGLRFPTKEEYGYIHMKECEKQEFSRWYEEEKATKQGVFNFREEMENYCRMDVTVLRICCMKFREIFREIASGMCPFASATTIAGLCNKFWRMELLKENQIGLLPSNSSHTKGTPSRKAVQLLSYLSKKLHCQIQHYYNGGEVRINGISVDGYCTAAKTVFEFYGCFFHGCNTCYNKTTVQPLRGLKMSEIYEETMLREARLKTSHLVKNVIGIWEHDYDRMLKENEEFRTFCLSPATSVPASPFNPRDAFYGGRTNAYKLYHRTNCDEGEKIFYYDVCSEYPFVNKTKKYPVGHPVVIRSNFSDISNYFGIIQCQILPPSKLLLPVVPYRCNGKLTFPLCRTCVESHSQSSCHHSASLRTLEGTWCSPELQEAVKLGYKIIRIIEVWHFPASEEGLFADYINKFLKLKTEASGWPSNVRSKVEKATFLKDYEEREGLKLNEENMKENVGLRNLAKLCLNSFWGRLGMQDNKPTTVHINTISQFHHYLFSGCYDVSSWNLLNDDILQLTYRRRHGFVEPNTNTNVVLAAFTTCWARLHIFQYMKMVEKRLLYVDTDSIIFSWNPTDTLPPTGNFLGNSVKRLAVHAPETKHTIVLQVT